jgi:hypothetical protein
MAMSGSGCLLLDLRTAMLMTTSWLTRAPYVRRTTPEIGDIHIFAGTAARLDSGVLR